MVKPKGRYVVTPKWRAERKTIAFKMLRLIGGSDGLTVLEHIEKHPKGVTQEQIRQGTGLREKVVKREIRKAIQYRLIRRLT